MKSEDIFSPFGLLKEKKDNYSYREGQEEMAVKVEKAFSESLGAIIEAGTGIGKSFAYLVPSLILIQNNPDSRVIISTSTTNLQKQLYDKDLPFLSKLLNLKNESTLLYGRNRYLCLKKYKKNKDSIALISIDSSTPEFKLDEWIVTTSSGSVLDIDDEEVRALANSMLCDENDCLRSHCEHYDECFFYSARRSCQKARIVITNHHIVLLDGQIRWENGEDYSDTALLPPYTHLVIDEAHHIESEATETFSNIFNAKSVKRELDSLSLKNPSLGGMNLVEFLTPYEKKEEKTFHLSFLKESNEIRNLLEKDEIKLHSIIQRYSKEFKTLLFDENFYSLYRSDLVFLDELIKKLSQLGDELLNSYSSRDDEIKIYIERAKRSGDYLKYLASTLSSFLNFSDFDGRISYAKNENGYYSIVIAPLFAGPLIKDRILDKIQSYLFCSATLSVDGNFNYFKERLGLNNDSTIIEGIYYSPFDYKKNLMYLVAQDGKEYNRNDNDEYISYASKLIRGAIESSNGGALVLFTSKTMMKSVYFSIKEKIGEKFLLLLQSDDKSKDKILSDFKLDRDSCLFATYSFWEGVDVPGDALRLLVIAKLPFDVPSDPINKARSDYIERKGEKSSFITLTLPNAMIKLKQGVGRLIRSENDRGVVLVVDGRLERKSYSKLFFKSLPPGYKPDDTVIENIDLKIERFLF